MLPFKFLLTDECIHKYSKSTKNTHWKMLKNGGLPVKHQAGCKTSTSRGGLTVHGCQSAVSAFLLAL